MVFPKFTSVCVLAGAVLLSACSGDDGKNGAAGTDGSSGNNGLTSLVHLVDIPVGDAQCFQGGVKYEQGVDQNGDGTLSVTEVTGYHTDCAPTVLNTSKHFNRIASFPVCSQFEPHCNTDVATSAEIIAASADGNTLVYSDSPGSAIGFIDISNPAQPLAKGVLAMGGEPTSVAVKDAYALVAVKTSGDDYVNVSGELRVVDIATQTVVRSIDIGGQPDSVAVSPDHHYAAVVIENERDEDLGDGKPPQLPAGNFIVANIADADPANWTISTVSLTGIADLYPSDPEPEYVDINSDNIAVVTLQENNHIVLIDLAQASIVNAFSAGKVDLSMIDIVEESPAIINQTANLDGVVREPDGVSWINSRYFATADEGDMDGGSRGFTVFDTDGNVVWSAGSELEHLASRFGHYPDSRSENKGNEPENIELGIFGSDRYLFVNSERSSLVFVYDVANPAQPLFKQILPAGQAPEGGLAIPSRNLLVVASEEDAREDKTRSVVNLYQYNSLNPAYPTLASVERFNGTPIPWSALSGLSADPWNDALLYSVEDSYYGSNRIFTINVDSHPAQLIDEARVSDFNRVFANLATTSATADATAFDALDLAAMINPDQSLNLDLEGVAKAADGGYWLVSEGAGTLSDTDKRPLKSLNFLIKTDLNAVVENVYTLPPEVNALQVRFGFEGVAEYAGKVYVAFQRAWEGESNPRIGIFNPAEGSWQFVFYPLNAPESQYGGWVGLSDIASLGNGQFLVVERDNNAGPDAAIKRLYKVDLASLSAGATVTKTLVRDLISAGDLTAGGGVVPEKIEGVAVMTNGDVYIVNDNDGVDNNKGETQLINLGKLF